MADITAPPRRRSALGRVLRWLVRLLIGFVIVSIVWVGIYRFVPPPVTFTMLANAVDGRGIDKDWMPLAPHGPGHRARRHRRRG